MPKKSKGDGAAKSTNRGKQYPFRIPPELADLMPAVDSFAKRKVTTRNAIILRALIKWMRENAGYQPPEGIDPD